MGIIIFKSSMHSSFYVHMHCWVGDQLESLGPSTCDGYGLIWAIYWRFKLKHLLVKPPSGFYSFFICLIISVTIFKNNNNNKLKLYLDFVHTFSNFSRFKFLT